jgi:hypothetical protein
VLCLVAIVLKRPVSLTLIYNVSDRWVVDLVQCFLKFEAVRLVKGVQVAAVTAKILGIPKQTLENWV